MSASNTKGSDILSLFQCENSRRIEETFAQVLSENDLVRLFFINENRAFTDGRNIIVDPASGRLFEDRYALERTEDFLQLDHMISADPWYARKMITRCQNIHECLHILYSEFPPPLVSDPRGTTNNRIITLSLILNIIEDAFIEAAGCSIYDNLELFLQFRRIALLHAAVPVEGTVKRAFKNVTTVTKTEDAEGQETWEDDEKKKARLLMEYLDHMGVFMLYPFIIQRDPSPELIDYVERTKQLFLDGGVCGKPKARYGFVQQIFDIIEPLIPYDEEELDLRFLKKILHGMDTHSGNNPAPSSVQSEGKTVEVTRRAFTDLDGNPLPPRNFSKQYGRLIGEYRKEKRAAIKIVLRKSSKETFTGSDFESANIHKSIKLVVTKPIPNLDLHRAYQNIYNKYRLSINSYNSRFAQLLKARVPTREEKRLFGQGITSSRLYDVKKRYWYRMTEDFGIPDIAIMLLIDGSGSMAGERRDSAIVSGLVLHEVLKKQGISHAIVEHRAAYGKPIVNHNILVDFDAKEEEKYNILTLRANEGTREGLSLLWAEKYINSKTYEEKKLIIVLSDGVPAHYIDEENYYSPPVSVKDAANAAKKITARGTIIVAVALDDSGQPGLACYDSLKKIYPSVVSCTDLKRLTGQLLSIISKNLS